MASRTTPRSAAGSNPTKHRNPPVPPLCRHNTERSAHPHRSLPHPRWLLRRPVHPTAHPPPTDDRPPESTAGARCSHHARQRVPRYPQHLDARRTHHEAPVHCRRSGRKEPGSRPPAPGGASLVGHLQGRPVVAARLVQRHRMWYAARAPRDPMDGQPGADLTEDRPPAWQPTPPRPLQEHPRGTDERTRRALPGHRWRRCSRDHRPCPR